MSGIMASTVGGGVGELVLNITSTVNPDISARLSAAGWLGTMQKIRIVSTGQVNTLDIPASLDGADITLDFSAASMVGGVYNGGTALKTRAHIKVSNLGTLAGGGGAGGGGSYGWCSRTLPNGAYQYAAGDGGARGNGQGFASGSLTIVAATAGGAGTEGKLAATGSFGGGSGRGSATAYGGAGGAGGGWGSAGVAGDSGGAIGDFDASGTGGSTAAGTAGKAVDGNSYITWINTGTRLGGIA